jgi:hypothetical protein
MNTTTNGPKKQQQEINQRAEIHDPIKLIAANLAS